MQVQALTWVEANILAWSGDQQQGRINDSIIDSFFEADPKL